MAVFFDYRVDAPNNEETRLVSWCKSQPIMDHGNGNSRSPIARKRKAGLELGTGRTPGRRWALLGYYTRGKHECNSANQGAPSIWAIYR